MRRRARGPVHRGIARRRDRRRFARHLREVQDDVRSHRGAARGGDAGEPARRGDGARPAGAPSQRRHARPLRRLRGRRRGRHSWRHSGHSWRRDEYESIRSTDDDGGVERDAARRRVARARGGGPAADDASARGVDPRGSVRRVRAGAGANSIERRRHRALAGFFRRAGLGRQGVGGVRRGDLVPTAGARSGSAQAKCRETVLRGLRRERRV
mmetsp:Transcript_6217/g.28505  ORF Transcript_6217/g.28505 Transcript_6217/m.28505 type:complete len:212 (-) Transcript_6217:3259-3894(-)